MQEAAEPKTLEVPFDSGFVLIAGHSNVSLWEVLMFVTLSTSIVSTEEVVMETKKTNTR
jgi:hypothetical protein